MGGHKINSKLNILAQELLNKFFFNKRAYAIQEKINNDVNFITRHERIDANKLLYYLENKNSVLSYQQIFDKLMWICLDFDIKKYIIMENSENYNFIEDSKYRPMLIEDVEIAIQYLKEKNIEYTLEYSGNRGVHIWIFFDYVITKKMGFTILDKIYNSIPFKYVHNVDSPIGVDLFPKVAEAKNNKVGKGVKIPLSYHLKSNRYSYLLGKDVNKIIEIDELCEKFVDSQINLISNIKRNNIQDLINTLEITEVKEFRLFERQVAKLEGDILLPDIYNMLNKCVYFSKIFSKPIDLWSEEERKIIVATLVRIKTDDSPNYGVKLLKELFSKAEGYDEKKTSHKIEKLKNLYPPTIAYLRHIFKIDCEYCSQKNITNTLQLLEGVEITTVDKFDSIIKWAINSEKNYLIQNDEVPLNYIYNELNKLSVDSIKEEIKLILKGNSVKKPLYNQYLRIESEEKTRKLYGMSAKDRVITTVIMKYIYDLIGADIISPISYSYRINTELTNNIFVNWNQLWLDFVKEIRDCITHKGYENHYVIKLDIKSFYDEINLTLLQEILHSKARVNQRNIYINMTFSQLNDDTKSKYINSCNYLINTCRCFGEKGVPQGPAFARFLAEIYLSALDNYIIECLDDTCDFSCRYVDDYYIFIKDHIKGEKIKNILGEELEKIYLTINSDKFMYGKVANLKEKIIEKNQFEKYFIDGIDEGTPGNVKNYAVKLLNNMFMDMDVYEDVKDLPFFLTHLIDEKYKKNKSKSIIKKVISSDIGRGSMFKHFYKNIAFKYSDLEFYKDIKGLSRSNFINQLQENIEIIKVDKIAEIVQYFLENDLYDYEKIELFRLILFIGLDVDICNFIEDNFDIVINVIFSMESVKWTGKTLSKILDKMGSIESKNKSIRFISHILSISKNMPVNTEIQNKIYSLLSISFNEITNKDIQNVFDLICYFTLYENSFPRISQVWKNILKHECIVDNKCVIDCKGWYKYRYIIDCNPILDKNILFFLNTVLDEHSVADDSKLAHSLETEFSLYLVSFLYDGTSFLPTITSDLKDAIKQRAIKENNLLLLWLCDGAEYLIDRKLALKNIQLNDRLILKKGTELLVRGQKKILLSAQDIVEEKWGSHTFDKYYAIYKLEETLCDYENKMKDKSCIEALITCEKIISCMEKDGLVNVFEKGTLTQSNDEIKFKYSKFDEVFIINETENINNIAEELYYKMFYNLCEIKLEPYKLGFDLEFTSESIFSDIVPQHRIFYRSQKSVNKDRVIFYLRNFIENMKKVLSKNTRINLYQMEQLKIESILQVVKKYKIKLPSIYNNWKEQLIVLDIYNGYYEKDYDKYILYKKCETRCNNLVEFINIIEKSISGNLSFNFIKDVKEFICNILQKVQEKITAPENFVLVDPKFSINDEKVEIQGKEYSFNTLKCIKLFESSEFEILNEEIAFFMESNKLIFFYDNILISVPLVFSRILDIVNGKSGKYDIDKFVDIISISNLNKFDSAIEKIQKQDISLSKEEAKYKLFSFLGDVDGKYYQTVIDVITNYKVMEKNEIDLFIAELKKYLDTGSTYVLPLKDYIKDRNGLYVLLEGDREISKEFGRNEVYGKKLENRIKGFRKDDNVYNDIAFVSDIGLSGGQIENIINNYECGKNLKNQMYYEYNFEILKRKVTNANKIFFINCIYTPFYKERVCNIFKNKFSVDSSKIEFLGTELKDYKSYQFNSLDQVTRKKFIEFIKECFPKLLTKTIPAQSIKYEKYLELCNSENLSEEDAIKTLLIARRESLPKCHQIVFENSIFRYRKD